MSKTCFDNENKPIFGTFHPTKYMSDGDLGDTSIGGIREVYDKNIYRGSIEAHVRECCNMIFNNRGYGVVYLIDHLDIINPNENYHDVFPASILFNVADGFGDVDLLALNHLYNRPLSIFKDSKGRDGTDLTNFINGNEFDPNNIILEGSRYTHYNYCRIVKDDNTLRFSLMEKSYEYGASHKEKVLLVGVFNGEKFICDHVSAECTRLTPDEALYILCKMHKNNLDIQNMIHNGRAVCG